MLRWLFAPLLWLPLLAAAQCELRGRVRGPAGPIPFASIALVGKPGGTSADEQGRFVLKDVPCGAVRISISAVGYTPLLAVPRTDAADLVVRLEPTITELEEVVVTGTLKEVSRSESPVPIEVITPKLFRRNPSPALFDAIGMVNGVRPQINCSVCNTGDIHINGMEGPYTMVLIDGMPIVSGLSTVYGLSGIPLGLIERVEVMKGPGSSLYGSEAMGGIINVITKDPALAPRLTADAFTTGWNEVNLDAGVRLGRVDGRVQDLFGASAFWYDDPRDRNSDGFTDLALSKRLSLFNKLSFRRPERRAASLAARYVREDRWGGQMNWTPAFQGSDSIYGESVLTDRVELIGQYQLPIKPKVLAQLSFNRHFQDSYYGTTRYTADQRILFGQAYWLQRLGPRHEATVGAAYRFTYYDDNTPATAAAQRLPLPGLFVQDEWRFADAQTLLLGYRMDHDRVHGLVHSPRLAYKFAPSGRWAVRGSFGTGFRVVNLFTEDHAALTGAREVLITEELRPERSLNGTINVVRKWTGERNSLSLDGQVFYNWFSNRIVPDYDADPDRILYANLDGHGVSQGAALTAEARIGQRLQFMMGATYMDVFNEAADNQGAMRQVKQYFAPDWSGTFTAGVNLPKRFTVDLTGQWYGPMRLPILPNDYRPEYSPTHIIANVQVKKVLREGVEFYGGVKNLLDFVPADPLIRANDPFDAHANDPVANPYGYTFDTAYIYAPLQGRRWFFGLRFTLD